MNLESKLKDLEQENRKLKTVFFYYKLKIIVHSLVKNPRKGVIPIWFQENEVLRNKLKELEVSSGSNSGKNQHLFNNFKKSTAVLAVLLMVSLNIGSLRWLSFVFAFNV